MGLQKEEVRGGEVGTLSVYNLFKKRYLDGGHRSPIFTTLPASVRLTRLLFVTLSAEDHEKSRVKTLP